MDLLKNGHFKDTDHFLSAPPSDYAQYQTSPLGDVALAHDSVLHFGFLLLNNDVVLHLFRAFSPEFPGEVPVNVAGSFIITNIRDIRNMMMIWLSKA